MREEFTRRFHDFSTHSSKLDVFAKRFSVSPVNSDAALQINLVKYKTAIFMYKVFYNLVPANILSHFTHISNVYSTRQHENLYVHYARTKHKQMCVEHMGVNIWNSIEIETRNCKDLKLFKVKYNKSLLTLI